MKFLKRIFFWTAREIWGRQNISTQDVLALSSESLEKTRRERSVTWNDGLFGLFRSAAGANFYRLLALATARVPLEFAAPLCLTPLLTCLDQGQRTEALLFATLVVLGSIAHGLVQNHFFNCEILIMSTLERLGLKSIAERGLDNCLTLATHDLPLVVNSTIDFAEIYARALILIFGIGMLFYKIGLAAFACVGLILIMGPLVKRLAAGVEEASNELAEARASRVEFLVNMAKNLATLRVFGLESNSNQEARSRRQAEVVTKKKLIWRGLLPTLIFYLGSTLVSIVGFAVYLSLGGVLSVEKIFSTFLVLKIIEEPLSSYAGFFISLARAKASFVRLKDLKPSARTPKIHVEMRDQEIHFSGMAPVRVRHGQTIGIVGATGSGKSTLLKALFEGLAPLATCHFVGQQPFVFEGTLRDNVLLGTEREDCELHDLLARCQFSAAHEMAIGEMGCNLSGGERQRVALARALASSAEIFFLDDALSAMDQRTRSLVGEELLGRAWRDKTVFLVSSQFAELARCDFYLYTENGQCEFLNSLADVEARIPILRPEMNRASETENSAAAPLDATIAKPEFNIWASLRTYFAHIDNSKRFPWRISLLVVVSAFTTFAGSLQNLWLSVWSNPSHATGAARWLFLSAAKFQFNPQSSFQGLGVYTMLGLIFLLTVAVRVILWEFSAIEAASRILGQAVHSVLKAKCRAVERIGTSQLAQRLSDDFNSVDDIVSASLEESFSAFLALLTCLATICIVAHMALIPVIAMALAWVYIFNSYLVSQKSLREMWIESKGKWLGHLRLLEENSEAVEQTGARKFIRTRLYKDFERYQSISLGQNVLGRWFYGLSPLIASVIFMCTLAITILSGMSGAVSALVITFSIQQWMLLNWMARTLTGVQAYGMSLHRLAELEKLPEESSQQKIKHEIGQQNRIEFRGVTLGYDRPVIEVEDFSLKQGELLFVHGRTGSGKSTLIKSLIGFSEVMAGTLNFNGLPVLSQASLRSLCAYVAQDPVILAGTVATNLSPLDSVNENELWECLETVQLARRVRSDVLQLNMSAHDLSQGERQLLCLARALLMKRPILILDEVSAQVDVNTEEEIVRIVRKIKPNFIVISISHRELLQTVADKSVHVSDARAMLQA